MSFPNGLVPTAQRVHPTPIYEFLAAIVIGHFLYRIWKPELGSAKVKKNAPKSQTSTGRVFAWYLIATGTARFLVELIRINPPSYFGFTNAQNASVVCVIAGVLLLTTRRAPAPANA
jgi:phosphatidylglycerol:prolipoprotein diacylglycerol transferase